MSSLWCWSRAFFQCHRRGEISIEAGCSFGHVLRDAECCVRSPDCSSPRCAPSSGPLSAAPLCARMQRRPAGANPRHRVHAAAIHCVVVPRIGRNGVRELPTRSSPRTVADAGLLSPLCALAPCALCGGVRALAAVVASLICARLCIAARLRSSPLRSHSPRSLIRRDGARRVEEHCDRCVTDQSG